MTETLTVVALDAADYALARRWECENVLLDEHGEIETFTHGADVPATVEVWPTVATGLRPEEHGIVAKQTAQDWENPLLRLASNVTRFLPVSVRATLGKPFVNRGEKKQFAQTDASHVFEDGYVFSWPGITDAEHLVDTWQLMFQSEDEEMSSPEFEGDLFKFTGSEFAWGARMSDTDAPIVGFHSHVLDAAGHAYARQPERLRDVYERVDRMLGWLRSETDRLVVLSDHGMQTSELDDDSPGKHSMRAAFGTTEEGPLPEAMTDVRGWLEERVATAEYDEGAMESDVDTDHLEALGYR